jgi:hypothetical protein
MEIIVEAAPYINTVGIHGVRRDLYKSSFDASKIANVRGEKPIKRYGFFESDDAYQKRLEQWEKAETKVLFAGWECKDMLHWQKLINTKERITIEFHESNYLVDYLGKEYEFPILPDTIDDFINDCKRIGVVLFWNDSTVQKFGFENITSEEKVTAYQTILKQKKKDASTQEGESEI